MEISFLLQRIPTRNSQESQHANFDSVYFLSCSETDLAFLGLSREEEGINLASKDMLLLTALIMYSYWAIPIPLAGHRRLHQLCKTPEPDFPVLEPGEQSSSGFKQAIKMLMFSTDRISATTES